MDTQNSLKLHVCPTTEFAKYLVAAMEVGKTSVTDSFLLHPMGNRSWLKLTVGLANTDAYKGWVIAPALALIYHKELQILRGEYRPDVLSPDEDFWDRFVKQWGSIANMSVPDDETHGLTLAQQQYQRDVFVSELRRSFVMRHFDNYLPVSLMLEEETHIGKVSLETVCSDFDAVNGDTEDSFFKVGGVLLLNAIDRLYNFIHGNPETFQEEIEKLREVLQETVPDDLRHRGCSNVVAFGEGLNALFIYHGTK